MCSNAWCQELRLDNSLSQFQMWTKAGVKILETWKNTSCSSDPHVPSRCFWVQQPFESWNVQQLVALHHNSIEFSQRWHQHRNSWTAGRVSERPTSWLAWSASLIMRPCQQLISPRFFGMSMWGSGLYSQELTSADFLLGRTGHWDHLGPSGTIWDHWAMGSAVSPAICSRQFTSMPPCQPLTNLPQVDREIFLLGLANEEPRLKRRMLLFSNVQDIAMFESTSKQWCSGTRCSCFVLWKELSEKWVTAR